MLSDVPEPLEEVHHGQNTFTVAKHFQTRLNIITDVIRTT